MNPTLRSALIGICAALAAYAGIIGVSKLAGDPSSAAISDALEDDAVSGAVTGGDSRGVKGVTGGVKGVTPRVTPVTPSVTPSLTPRISPTPWQSLTIPTPATGAVASVTPTPSLPVPLSPSPTPWPSPTPTPSATPTPTEEPASTQTPAPTVTPTPEPELRVVINEIAWAGTEASQYGEWIELYNEGDFDVDLTGWMLREADTAVIALSGTIRAGEYYLIERTTPTSPDPIADIVADLSGSFGGSGLKNAPGEDLQLRDASGNLVDRVDCSGGWFAGDASTKATMERGADGTWHTGGSVQVGTDAGGNPINGTPRYPNGPGAEN